MTFSRRQLFASAGAATAILALDDLTFGALDGNAFASTLELDHETFGALDANVLAGARPPSTTFEAQDWTTGVVMWDGGYSDMPYMAAMPSGVLLSTLTVNQGVEGGDAQHVIVLHSTDRGDTWQTVAELEPADGPEASWAMPWLAPSGRLYVLYTYNRDNIRQIPNSNGQGAATRVDSVGVLAYRSTIDDGVTWTERGELELPASPIDDRNPFGGPFGGDEKLFWLSGHPVTWQDVGYLGVSKCGTVTGGSQFNDTEAFVLAFREHESALVVDHLSAAIRSGGPVTEEPSPVILDDGTVHVVFRTVAGMLGEAWSTDDGATWTVDWSRDEAGAVIPQPRAKAAHLRMPDGRFLLWGHNSAAADGALWGPRNPAFYRIGEAAGPRIAWGAPRLLMWDKTPATTISYPGFLFDDAGMMVAATDKRTAKLFRYPLDGI